MNIAFPALLLFLLLVPGFLFRTAFKSLEGEQVDAGPFASTTLKSILMAIALNLIAWAIIEFVLQPVPAGPCAGTSYSPYSWGRGQGPG